MKLNIGCGRNILDGFVNIDRFLNDGVDIPFDLEKCDRYPLPIEDDKAENILINHALEHINNVLPLMQELYRVAKPGCVCEIRVPHGSSNDAWEDPTHVRPYYEDSFMYFAQPTYWRADYGYRGDWKTNRIVLLCYKGQFTDGNYQKKILHGRNYVAEMAAFLECVKPIRQQEKALMDQVKTEVQLV